MSRSVKPFGTVLFVNPQYRQKRNGKFIKNADHENM